MILVFTVLGLFSCGKKAPLTTPLKKPDHLLTQTEMVDILVQVHLLESAVNLRNAKNQTQNKKDLLRVPDIFLPYKTNQAGFLENFNWYSSQPQLLLTIYDEVLVRLTRMQAEEDKKKT